MNPESDVERLIESGLELEARNRPEEALQYYDAAIAQRPDQARAHFLRGNILLDRGDAAAALQAYRQAVSHKPDSAGAHCNLGNAYLQLADPLAAKAAFEQALALRPDLSDARSGLQAAQELAFDQATHAFEQGLVAQEGGQTEEAAYAYRQALALHPERVDALNNLAGLLLRQGDVDAALPLLRRAAELAPDGAAIFLNLGDALSLQQEWSQAVASYRRAGQLEPDKAEGPVRMGDALRVARRPGDAATAYRQALLIDPLHIGAHLGLAIILSDGGQLDQAQDHCREVLKQEPDHSSALHLSGVLHKKKGQSTQAANCFRQLLAKQPELLEAHINLGAALQDVGDFDVAATCYAKALSLAPQSAAAHCGLGTLRQRLGNHAEAERCYQRALELDPGLVMAHSNLGLIYTHSRQFDRASEHFRHALELDPKFAAGHANYASMLKDMGRIDAAVEALQRALALDDTCTIAHNNLLFIQNYEARQSGAELLAQAKYFGEVVSRLAVPCTSWNHVLQVDRALRVGLVSGDLGNHPVGHFLESVLVALKDTASTRLHFYAYSNRTDEDETSQRLRACCAAWLPCSGIDDASLARRIQDDGIDILIDLAGHTGNNRLSLFAWKPAPVQMSWLGYFATTGLPAMDYFLADPWTLPPDQEVFFSEQIWRLPETRLCFTAPSAVVEVGPPPALTNGYVTFGSFNNLSKMTDAVVELWSRILRAVPGSKLFLKYGQLEDPSVRGQTVERFARHGITSERLVLEGHSSRSDYHLAHQRMDIALDPFPFPGGTTTMEALWMGVPVLTLNGERFLARQGVGLLMNAGLADWVAADTDDYVRRAARQAADLQGLAALRSRLRGQVLASPVCDANRFARHFEAALREMWGRWCKDQRKSAP